MKRLCLFLSLISCLPFMAQQPSVEKIVDDYKLGLSILENENYQEAYDYVFKASEASKIIKNDSLIAFGDFYLGSYFYKKREYDKSLEFTKKALINFEKINNQKEISNCHRKLGVIYKKRSDFENALFHNFESLKINELLNNENDVAEDLNQIGTIYSRTKDFEAAEVNLKKALEINRKNNNKKAIVANLSNLGAINQRTQNFDIAFDYYYKALEMAEVLSLDRNRSILLGNLGSTLRSLYKYDESLEYLFKALKLKKELKRNGSIAHTCVDISETYLEMGKYEKAKEYALLAVEYAENENLELERFAYFLASKSDYNLGDYKGSYDNLRLYTWLNDSVFSIQKTRSINEMQIKYETEKRDLKIQAQESDIKLLGEKNKVKNQWLLFGGIGFLGVFGLILLNRSRNAARKRELLQEKYSHELIVAQENERTRVSKELHDSVGQQLTLLKKKAQNLEQQELSTLASTALEEVREISRALYPSNLKQLGLSESIEQLLFDLDEVSEMFFTVEIDNINKVFNEEQSLNFYRFIQEAVNNVLKHAKAKALLVSIKKSNDFVEVLIKDNGLGFDDVRALKKKSLGLKTMSERIRMLKGKLIIQSQKGEGAVITAKIAI